MGVAEYQVIYSFSSPPLLSVPSEKEWQTSTWFWNFRSVKFFFQASISS